LLLRARAPSLRPPRAPARATSALRRQIQLATVPPKEWKNGWPAFGVSMSVIILWTVIMFYLAKIFGCASGLSDAAVAIAFLAGGTSLPDTFSSRIAAMHMSRADEAIGNITGSNAVNVFLGLGLPWCIGAFYHQFHPEGNGIYTQPAENLAFTVVLYIILNVACVAILYTRRVVFGGELGGPMWGTRLTYVTLIILYLLFVVLAISNESGTFEAFRR
jgi:solute carrier family 8 (sodium/calcium exchanger)